MKQGLAIIGAVVGVFVAAMGNMMLGLLVGIAFGLLLVRVRELDERLTRLEREAGPGRQPSPAPAPVTAPAPVATPAARKPDPAFEPEAQAETTPASTWAPPRQARAGTDDSSRARPAKPTIEDRLMRTAKAWLTTGNVPVKLGVLVSFFGVAFLLKYAVERQMFVVPIEIRLLIVAAAAIGLLAFGWHLRERVRVYGLSLQGGGVGVLYLTIFAAFRLYDLLPPTPAFFLLVALTAFAGVIALLQDARALAVLGIVGGFLAPVLVSTGSGDHVALFSYYLVLNLAILGIARFRAWRELNVLGFLFTFVIGSMWGYRYYRPEFFASTEPFLILHFLLYQAVVVLFALRQPPRFSGLVDGTIVFGTPVVTFALQAYLVRDTEYGLAISAVAVGIFYAGLATWLWRSHRDTLRLLTESFLALAVAFATIAIPLALDARWTAAAWALEGAALVWVGTRQHHLLPKMAGAALVFLAGLSFMEYGWHSGVGLPILNGNLLGGLLIASSSLLAARLLSEEEDAQWWQRAGAVGLFVWGAAWWLGSGALEIEDRVSGANETHLLTLFIAGSGLLCTLAAERLRWSMARIATQAHLPLQILVGFLYLLNNRHPFVTWGLVCWAAAIWVQMKILWDYEAHSAQVAGRWHIATVISLVMLLFWEVLWQVDHAPLSQVWAGSAASLVPAAFIAGILYSGGKLSWPVSRHWGAYLIAAGALVIGELCFVTMMVLDLPGDPAPLTYLPVLNPFDIATLVALLMGLRWLLRLRAEGGWFDVETWKIAWIVLGAFGFGLTTIAVMRGVMQYSGLSWRASSLLDSVAVQAALSIYWGMLGVLGMVVGARRHRRIIWLAGAGLMALVVVKLFLVDLGNTETVARIVSFIGVGALLLVVGYFAPAPPRATVEKAE